MPKQTYTHTIDGRTFTRTSARHYEYVLVVRDERERDIEAEFQYLADAGHLDRFSEAVAYAKASAERQRKDLVLSWHRDIATATKALEAVRRRGGWTHARIEQIRA